MPLDPLLEEPPTPRPEAPVPPSAHSAPIRRRHLVAVVVTLLGLVAALFVVQNAEPGSTGAGRVVAWPDAPSASPATPTPVRPWPGTLSPPTPTEASASGAPSAAAPTPTAGAGGADFCRQARDGASALGSDSLALLRSLATGGADSSSQARGLVQQSLAEATALRNAAPGAVADAATSLATTWSRLSAALDSSGYDRVTLVALAVKYLASPAVALAVETLGSWATANCGASAASSAAPSANG